MVAIGIDMSKLTFHAAFDETTVRIFQNTEDGAGAFIGELASRGYAPDATTVGVEATGAYHLFLCARLVARGWRIVVLNPLEAHRAAEAASLRKVKTDRVDALLIRRMVAQGRGYAYADTDATIALKALVSEREGLVLMTTMAKTRMEAHAMKQRAVSVPLHDGFSPTLAALRKEIRAIEKQFAAYEPDTQRLLRSIPGVGIVTAATTVAFVGDIGRFSSPEKLVAYLGLDCRVYESGTSVKGKGRLVKRGNVYARHVLFNAAFIAKRLNPDFKAYFEKKVGEGRHYFSALCAVERKLVHLIYAVWKRGTPFTPEPPKRKQS